MYETRRDATLPHQVVILSPHPQQVITVSCNCRRVRVGRTGWKYEPMGESKDYADTVRLYNDPNNHVEAIGMMGPWNGLRVPFGEEWMLRGLGSQSV